MWNSNRGIIMVDEEFVKFILFEIENFYAITVMKEMQIIKCHWTEFDKRIILKINDLYYAKVYCNDWFTPTLCKDIVDLVSLYRKKEIPFAEILLTTKGTEYISLNYNNMVFYCFLEKKLFGCEINQLSTRQASAMGDCLGKMHLCSKEFVTLADHDDPLYGLFTKSKSKNAVDVNYTNMKSFCSRILDYNKTSLVTEIWNKFIMNRNLLRNLWDDLPRIFVTNDFLAKNIQFVKEGISGVFDFHLACSKSMIYDFVQTALFNFRIITSLSEDLYRSFCTSYLYYNHFNSKEEEAGIILSRILSISWKSYLNNIIRNTTSQDITKELILMRNVLRGDYDCFFILK